MRVKSIGLALIGALVAVGCKKDGGPFFAPEVPLAYTRFINAIPDNGSVDFRFVDLLEYSPSAIQVAFRGFTPYQGTAPGSRHLKVFNNPGGSPSLDDVTLFFLDEQLTFEADKYYTIVAVGYSKSSSGTPSLVMNVYEDAIPDAAGNVAYRVVNLATGLGAVNVSLTAASSDAIPGTADFASVAYLDQSAYLTKATGAQWFRVQQTSSATEIVSGNGRQAPAGSAGDPLAQLSTRGGSGQAGSVVTAFVFPAAISGSGAPNVTSPSVIFTIDKHPR